MINVLPGIGSTTSALQAEQMRMEVIAQNIANVNTTRDIDGQPYQRQQVVFETLLNQEQRAGLGAIASQGVQVARIEKDTRPPRMIFNPGSPEADANGMV